MSENPEMSAPPPPPQDPPASPPPPPPGPPQGTSGDSNRTLMLVLAYLGPLALVPFLAEKEDREVQWHAKHGLVLMVAEIAFYLVLTIIGNIVPPLGCIFVIVIPFLSLAILVVHIVCIVKATKGEKFLIPGLSPFADKF